MDGLSRTRHWAWGAVIAVLCSLAYAKAPNMPHGGGAFSHGGADRAMRMEMRGSGRYAGAAGMPRTSPARNSMAARDPRTQRSANFAGANYGNSFGGYQSGTRRIAGPSAYGDGRGRMQYAGAITPVSAESRPVPRPPPNTPMRSGSIRADVTRYNEERGGARAMPRPADDPRQSEGSPYRN
ncbi:hypothetical protein [Paraburkholderia susongensis]|uniref:hypothetical protein n=1 Tax=Paraburkholderia susongensis TaxID=1515439 RepID=UPI000A1C8A8D|nr:hypothetical protein [Paraburkholderia susongensis]